MALRWFVDASRARLDWSAAIVDGKATTTIYELVQRQDRSEVALLRFRWALPGDAVSASRVAAAQAVASGAAIPTATLIDAVPHPRLPAIDRPATISGRWDFTTSPTVNGGSIGSGGAGLTTEQIQAMIDDAVRESIATYAAEHPAGGSIVDNGDGTATWNPA